MTVAAVAQSKVDTRIHIFDNNVRSLKVCLASNMYVPPVLMMNSDDRLLVNFDYLDYDVHYLRYSVTHCNADWQPSQLVESEYVSGFNYADIDDYAPSEATYVHYYNYQFTLPNSDMEFLVSGNYLLSVYEQDDPSKILFQTRFSVCEGKVSVFPQVTSRTDIEYNNRFQQVSFDIRYKPNQIKDPYSEFTCIVSQNSRDDNAVVVNRPTMVGVDHVTYEHNRDLIFAAGNEFRRFETVNAHNINMGVQSIRYYEPMYHAVLMVDEPRNELQYLYDKTQYGRFTIRNAEAFGENALQADYMITHFSLNTLGKLNGGNVWLYGEFLEGYPASQAMMAQGTVWRERFTPAAEMRECDRRAAAAAGKDGAGTDAAARADRRSLFLVCLYIAVCAAFFIAFFPYASGIQTPTGWLDAMNWFGNLYY